MPARPTPSFRRPPRTTLTIYKIREDVTDPDDILPHRGTCEAVDVRLEGRLVGVLYLTTSPPRPPKWARYFTGSLPPDPPEIRTSSAAGVFLIKRPTGYFGIAFGHGRFQLDPECVEPGFGLRVSLNAVEPSNLRSLDHRRLDAGFRHTREQVSRGASLLGFGLDVERDLLRAVTGVPRNESDGAVLSGADPLLATGDLALGKLEVALDRYDALFRSTEYREGFSWVDNIAQVSDTLKIEHLNGRLIQSLREGPGERPWLAVPEILEWGDLSCFAFGPRESRPEHLELNLADYFRDVRPMAEVTVERLKSDRVFAYSGDDIQPLKQWPVYKCLIAELQSGEDTHILSEGLWYRVNRQFRAEVEAGFAAIGAGQVRLPSYGDSCEKDYNIRAAAGSGGNLVLMDRELISISRYGQIEVCDLYSLRRELIHVKRYSGSSTLSHLFNQGLVSAELLLRDNDFRTQFNLKLPASHRLEDPQQPINPGSFEVAFVIVTERGVDLQVPFFSQLTMRNAATMLRRMGFRVSLSQVRALQPGPG